MQKTPEEATPKKNGLIYAYILDNNGQGKSIDWEQVRAWQPQQGYLWVHLDYTNPIAKQWLLHESGLDPITVDSMTIYDVRPRIVTSPEGLMVLLRGVNLNPGAKPEDMVSIRVWVDKSRIITTRHRLVLSVNDVNEMIAKGHAPKNPSNFLAILIDLLINRMADVIEHINTNVDKMEAQVIDDRPYVVRSRIAKLRRQVIALRRFLAPQRDILVRLSNEDSMWLEKSDRLHIREATDRVIYYLEDLDEARERAAVTHEELSSRISETIDQRMLLLSLVAVIFLPLSFITGLLGVNIGGLPGINKPWAFPIVSITLIAIAVGQFIFFKRKKWL